MKSPRVALGLLVSCLALSPASLLLAQAPFDPQSLVGEWVGKWSAGATSGGTGGRGGTQGPYSLVITRVQGDQVFGKVEFQEFSGNVRGRSPATTSPSPASACRTELTIHGNEMRGTRQATAARPREIQLLKK